MKRICLLIPSLAHGGAERVMSLIANSLSDEFNLEVHLILYTKGTLYYEISDNVILHLPEFDFRKYPFVIQAYKVFVFLRKTLIKIKPDYLLSFGGKYNSFVLLASEGLGIKRYISDRSQPTISYGIVIDFLNKYTYRRAAGIIAQTWRAKEVQQYRTHHPNIQVIPNPIRELQTKSQSRKNIVLNVGRFIKSKNQKALIQYFAEIRPEGWRLVFIGDGPLMKEAQREAEQLGISKEIDFLGVVSNIDDYYLGSKVFAFTSVSEGFPNALAEAMSSGCACISYDCEVGPSDLIDDGINGLLIPSFDHHTYIRKLKNLIIDESLREHFGKNARMKMASFNRHKIVAEYANFLLNG